jgi:hypothetical protein
MVGRTFVYQLILAFFGLNQQYRIQLFTEIDEIVVYGDGYDWATIYNMPIWLRKFTYKKIEERFKKKNEELDAQNNLLTADNAATKMLNAPQVNNLYTANIKAPKKK